MLVLLYKRLSNYLLITPFESSNTGAISANETISLVDLVLTVDLWPFFEVFMDVVYCKQYRLLLFDVAFISSLWTKIYFNFSCFKVSILSSQYMSNIKLELIKCFIEVINNQYLGKSERGTSFCYSVASISFCISFYALWRRIVELLAQFLLK